MTILARVCWPGTVAFGGKPLGAQGNENIIMDRADAKMLLVEIYRAAIAAVAPGPALIRALQNDRADGRGRCVTFGSCGGDR